MTGIYCFLARSSTLKTSDCLTKYFSKAAERGLADLFLIEISKTYNLLMLMDYYS